MERIKLECSCGGKLEMASSVSSADRLLMESADGWLEMHRPCLQREAETAGEEPLTPLDGQQQMREE